MPGMIAHYALFCELISKLPDELFRLERRVGFDPLSNLTQKACDGFFGRLDQEFARVLAYVKSEEIKAIVYVCNTGLLLREFQTPFPEKRRHRRLYFHLQHFFRCAGDDKVIGISHDMDLLVSRGCPSGDLF